LRVPKLRAGVVLPSLLEHRRRVDQALFAVVMQAHLEGMSTRKVDDLVKTPAQRQRVMLVARCTAAWRAALPGPCREPDGGPDRRIPGSLSNAAEFIGALPRGESE
jgi:hypothetical protein